MPFNRIMALLGVFFFVVAWVQLYDLRVIEPGDADYVFGAFTGSVINSVSALLIWMPIGLMGYMTAAIALVFDHSALRHMGWAMILVALGLLVLIVL